jgi:hypothetical protein
MFLDQRTQQAIESTLTTLRNRGNAESYIKTVRRTLQNIAKNTDIFNSEEVKKYLTTHETATHKNYGKGTIQKMIGNYNEFCKENQIPFDKPKISYKSPIPIIPKTEDVQAVIADAYPDMALCFTIQAEIGTEGEELAKTPRKQIDSQQGIISINGVKKHNNGTYKLQPTTAEMLRQYLSRHTEEYPFPSSKSMQNSWRNTRNNTAKKLCRPEIKNILFKNLRNYAGAVFYLTMGKDPIQTKNFMRHIKLEQTMDYLRGLTEFSANATYISKVATTAEEAIELLNQGFKEQAIFNEKHIYTKLKY